MDDCRNFSTNSVGFCLLPSELIQSILLSLALPEIFRMKLVNKSLACLVSDQDFVHQCNLRSKSATWLFVYKRQWRRYATLHGFSDQSDRWFKIFVDDLMKPMVSPSEDVYLLTGSGNILLFASNARKAVIAVNLVSKMVKRIPPCPLGPRGTSSWRRPGMKLLPDSSGSCHFRFAFAELIENRPVVLVYDSVTDNWQSTEANDSDGDTPRVSRGETDLIFLHVVNRPYESVLVAVGSACNSPVALRPRFSQRGNGTRSMTDQLHVYGDGYVMTIKSEGPENANKRKARMVSEIELWGIGLNGRNWDYQSEVPSDVVKLISRPYGALVGCLEERDGRVRAVLVFSLEGSWDVVWLCCDKDSDWSWIRLPDCNMKGLNMAGITFSAGLTLA